MAGLSWAGLELFRVETAMLIISRKRAVSEQSGAVFRFCSLSRWTQARHGALRLVTVLSRSSRCSQARHGALRLVPMLSGSSRCSHARHGGLRLVTVLSGSSRCSQARHGALRLVTVLSRSSRCSQARHGGILYSQRVKNPKSVH